MQSARKKPWFWVVIAIILYGPFIDTGVGQGNVSSDLAAIESLVERGTFFINDATYFNTIDKFRIDGRYFSQKSPIFHLVAAIPYGLSQMAGFSLAENIGVSLRLITLFMVIIPMGLILCVIHNHPWLEGRSNRGRLMLTLGFALGSLLTSFCVTLNHYVPAALFLTLASVEVIRLLQAEGAPLRCGLLCGLWISASLSCDVPPAFLFGAGVACPAVLISLKSASRERGVRFLGGLIAGALPLVFLYAVLNIFITGSPLPPNLQDDAMQYFPGSYWAEVRAQAEAGNPGYYQASYVRRLFHATLGHKGIYWMMPLLVLASLQAVALCKSELPERRFLLGLAAFPLVAVAVTMIWGFDLSGGAYGIRHVYATLPPLYCVLGLKGGIDWLRTFSRRALFMICLAWGMIIAWIGVIEPWSHNTFSAYPPLENLSRLAIEHEQIPDGWVEGVIESTSIKKANAWLDLGLMEMGKKDLARAELYLSRAYDADPKSALPLFHLGVTQAMSGRPDAALKTYDRLLKKEPKNVGAWNNRGRFGLAMNRFDIANESFARSYSINENAGTAARNLELFEAYGGTPPANEVWVQAARRQTPRGTMP